MNRRPPKQAWTAYAATLSAAAIAAWLVLAPSAPAASGGQMAPQSTPATATGYPAPRTDDAGPPLAIAPTF